MSTDTKVTERPSTISRVFAAGKVAAIGKVGTAVEEKILKAVKSKAKEVYPDLPEHPFYDKLILAAIPVIAMEVVNRRPDLIPGADNVWITADAMIQFQACREADEGGKLIASIADEVFQLLSSFGAAARALESSDWSAEAEKVKEKVKLA